MSNACTRLWLISNAAWCVSSLLAMNRTITVFARPLIPLTISTDRLSSIHVAEAVNRNTTMAYTFDKAFPKALGTVDILGWTSETHVSTFDKAFPKAFGTP